MTTFTRRGFIGAASAAALLPRMAQAQSSQIIVGTWGGDYGDLLRESIDIPIMKPMGIEVLQDISGPVPRRTKLLAERQNRRGSMDVACLADFDMFAATQRGVLEDISEQVVPRTAKVLPFLRKPNSIPQIYSAHTIVYNTSRVPTPPKSIHDLWDPEYRGKVGLSDFLFTTNTAFAAIAGGGSMTNFEPAKKKLMEWRSLDVKVLASTEAVAAPLKLLYTPGAVVIGIVLPYMVLTLSAVIEGIPRQTEEVAANLGARPFTVFRRVVLPLAMPGVLAGSVLVFILSMNAYATPVLLGGPQFQMMAPAVYDQFNRVSNWPFGAALAFILLTVTLIMTLVGSAAMSRKYKAA